MNDFKLFIKIQAIIIAYKLLTRKITESRIPNTETRVCVRNIIKRVNYLFLTDCYTSNLKQPFTALKYHQLQIRSYRREYC